MKTEFTFLGDYPFKR